MAISIPPKPAPNSPKAGEVRITNSEVDASENGTVLAQYRSDLNKAGKENPAAKLLGFAGGGLGAGAIALGGMVLLERLGKLPGFLKGPGALAPRLTLGVAAALGAIGGFMLLNKIEHSAANSRQDTVRDRDRPTGLPLQEVTVSGAPAYKVGTPNTPADLNGTPLLHEQWRHESNNGPLWADRTIYLQPGSAVKLEGAKNLDEAKQAAKEVMIDKAAVGGLGDAFDSANGDGKVLLLQMNDGSYWAGTSKGTVERDRNWNYYSYVPDQVAGRNDALKAVVDIYSVMNPG